jgi:hypothetical protein
VCLYLKILCSNALHRCINCRIMNMRVHGNAYPQDAVSSYSGLVCLVKRAVGDLCWVGLWFSICKCSVLRVRVYISHGCVEKDIPVIVFVRSFLLHCSYRVFIVRAC